MALDDNIRVGLIGTGAIAEVHAQVIDATPGAQLTHVTSRSRVRAERFAASYGATLVEDVDRLIEECDAVVISCPGHAHAAYTLAALEAGRAVLCEKPGAVSVAEAEQLVELSRGRIYRVGLNRRFAPVYARVREAIASRTLVPTSYNARINRGELVEPAWVADPKQSGGYAFETLIHLLDLVRHLFGEVEDVASHITRHVATEPDNFSMLLGHSNGVHGTLSSCAHATWLAPFERLEVFGANVTLRTSELSHTEVQRGLEAEAERSSFADLEDAVRGGFTQQMRSFLGAISGDDDDPVGARAEDVLAAARLIARVHETGGR